MQANGTMPALAVRPIACHACGAVATVRRAKEYLCSRCAVSRVGVDRGERPVVLCDRCGRQSLIRVRESFLCARCATSIARDARMQRLERENEVLERMSTGLERQIEEMGRQREELLRTLRRAEADRRWAIRRLVDAKDQERRRISMELHDDAVQMMIGVRMQLEATRRSEPDEARRVALERLEAITQDCVGRLRALMTDLRTDLAERQGLVPAIRQLLDRTAEESGLSVALAGGLTREPDLPARTTVHRIVQEALANVRKHARATRVDVTIKAGDDGVGVSVRDDGVGFEVEAATSGEHLGLEAMKERTKLAGGTLTIDSLPGAGTIVTAWIPGRIHEVADPPSVAARDEGRQLPGRERGP